MSEISNDADSDNDEMYGEKMKKIWVWMKI